jgi:hypothetical protein
LRAADGWRNFPHYNPRDGWHTDAVLVRGEAGGGLTEIDKKHPPYYGQLPLLPGTPGA